MDFFHYEESGGPWREKFPRGTRGILNVRRRAHSRLHSQRRAAHDSGTNNKLRPARGFPGDYGTGIRGMTCANCARHVTEAIQGVPDVAGASVRLEAGEGHRALAASANLPAVVRAVKEAGYEARPLETEQTGGTRGRVARCSWAGGSTWWRDCFARCR